MKSHENEAGVDTFPCQRELCFGFFVLYDSSIISEFFLITARTSMSSDLKEGENQTADSKLSSKRSTSESRPCSSSCSSSASASTMASSSSDSDSSRPIQRAKSLEKMPPPPPPPPSREFKLKSTGSSLAKGKSPRTKKVCPL